MLLTMKGTVDLRFYFGVDDSPFKNIYYNYNDILARGNERYSNQSQIPASLRESIARDLGCDVEHLSFDLPEVPFPIWPILGRGLRIIVSEDSDLCYKLKSAAMSLASFDREGIWTKEEIEIDGEEFSINFSIDKIYSILASSEIHIHLHVFSIGFMMVTIEIESRKQEFDQYWYPLTNLIETSTYSFETLGGLYENIGHHSGYPGNFNESLRRIRRTLSRYFPHRGDRITAIEQKDEVESGFHYFLQSGADEISQHARALVQSFNGPAKCRKVRCSEYRIFAGWGASYICNNNSKNVYYDVDYASNKPIYNGEICQLVYNIFFYYDRYITEYLKANLTSKNGARKADMEAERDYGDAVYYLADLGRSSQSSSDRKFYDAWLATSSTNDLRQRTRDGISLIISRIKDHSERQTKVWAKRLSILTFIIGLASLLGWLNGLRTYLTGAGSKEAASLSSLSFSSAAAHDVFWVYSIFFAVLVGMWIWTTALRR